VSAALDADGAERTFFVLTLDGARLEIDASRGGRVTALRLDDRNLLSGAEVDAINYGSTFWTSPQSDWGWPPLEEIDSAPYAGSLEGDAVVLRGPVSPALGVSVEKRLEADRARDAFVLVYRVVNHGPGPTRVAPWEVTRVQPNGLTFFATGAGTYAPSDLPAREQDGATWVHHDAAVISGHQKLFADAAEGWVAHVDQDALFVKSFALVPRTSQAPGEAQIEIYASSLHRYVEVEQQGACETLPPGGALTWRVEWRVRRLPADVPRAIGAAALVRFARAVAAGAA
jgi:Domain of unknown function (DUF4380)